MEAASAVPPIPELRLFDTCVTLGRVVRGGVPVSVTPENVLDLLDKYDIAEALVHDNEARLTRPRRRGNERLLERAAGIDRLHPVWVLEPPAEPEPAACAALVEEMLGRGVRVARLMMGEAPPLLWMWDDLLSALEEHRVPCMLDFAPAGYAAGAGRTCGRPDDAAMNGLRDICLAHPDLPMVLSHVSGGLGLARSTLPLMHRAANLHLDVTSVVNYWRTVAAELGPERIFFATGMPFYEPATFIANIQYARGFDLEAKRRMCGENLRALMEAVQ